jgi:glycosyltransferase involved in cell wall biosynthesis
VGEPIKVLHVLEAVEGGTARHLRDLVMYGEGAQHAVAVPRERHGHFTDFDALEDIRGVAAHTLHVDMRRSPASWRNPVAVARIAAFARRWGPDVIHGHSSIGGVAARIIGAARPRTAVVWTPNGVLTDRVTTTIERTLARLTDKIIAVSDSEAELLRELSIGTADQLAVIPNGIELHPTVASSPSLRELCGIPTDAPIIGSIARLSAQKGIDTLVESARIVFDRQSTAWFVLIGSGDLGHVARDAAARMPRFAWLDGLPQARGVLDQFSLFVLLSRYEGMPYALMEAMAAGLPCVVTDAVGNRDIVTDEETGLLVPVDAPGTAAEAVLRFLSDDALRAKLGAAAQDRAREFDAAIMAERTVGLYRDCLAAKG